jgi:hypothetical protein
MNSLVGQWLWKGKLVAGLRTTALSDLTQEIGDSHDHEFFGR